MLVLLTNLFGIGKGATNSYVSDVANRLCDKTN